MTGHKFFFSGYDETRIGLDLSPAEVHTKQKCTYQRCWRDHDSDGQWEESRPVSIVNTDEIRANRMICLVSAYMGTVF